MLIFKAPSGVVTHTCARGGAATAGSATASARAAVRISAPRRLHRRADPVRRLLPLMAVTRCEACPGSSCTKQVGSNGASIAQKVPYLRVTAPEKVRFLTNSPLVTDSSRVSAGPDIRRERNRARVLAGLREAGSASRADLARRTGLSRTTVASIVADLELEGVLLERDNGGGASPRGGRPPRLLFFSRSAGAVVGIDFGKRHLRVAAADLSHAIIAEAERPMPTDEPAEIGLETAVELVDEVLGQAGVSRADVIGVGVGLPGPIDMSSGRVGSSSILPGWVGVRAAEALSSRLDLPVQVDNDADLGALAELHWARPPAIGTPHT